MSQTEFSQGGYVAGPSTPCRMVPESRPRVGGEPFVIYADECFISSDAVCRRADDWHKAADVTPGFWVCATHPRTA